MKVNTKPVLRILHIFSWILFVGISIEAGGFLVGTFFTLVNPNFVKNLWLWQEVNLSDLYNHDQKSFFTVTLLMSIVAIIKAWLFYLIVRILYDKKLNMAQPFSNKLGRFIFSISYLSLLIGICSWSGVKYIEWLVAQGLNMPDIRYLRLDGANVWLFMGVTLLVIAQIFKRGIEIQSENELTV